MWVTTHILSNPAQLSIHKMFIAAGDYIEK